MSNRKRTRPIPKYSVGERVKVCRAHLEGDIRPSVYYPAVIRSISHRADSHFSDSIPYRYNVSTEYFNSTTNNTNPNPNTNTCTLGYLQYRDPSVPEHLLLKSHEQVPAGSYELPLRCPPSLPPPQITSIKQNSCYLDRQDKDCSFVKTSTVPCPEQVSYENEKNNKDFRTIIRKELAECLQMDLATCRENMGKEDTSTKESSSSFTSSSSTSTSSASSTTTTPNNFSTRQLTLVQGLPDTYILDFSKAELFLSTLREATHLDHDVVAVTKNGITSVRNPDEDFTNTPMRVSISCCSGTHEVGTVQSEFRHLTDGIKQSSSTVNVETTHGFKYTYSPLSESHVVSRCMSARIRICLEELTCLLRAHGVLHHDVNACQLLSYDVRKGVSIGFHHDGSPSCSQAENSQLLGTSVLSITLGLPMNLVFAIQHKTNINNMDEILSVLLSHGTVLSMGPITDMMYKHSARGLSSKSEIMKNDTHNGMRHVFVCRALTILKRFYGKGYGHPDFPYQLVPTHAVVEHRASLIRDRLSKHQYPVRIYYNGGEYTGYCLGKTSEDYLEVWIPSDNSCVEVRSMTGVEFLKNRYPGF